MQFWSRKDKSKLIDKAESTATMIETKDLNVAKEFEAARNNMIGTNNFVVEKKEEDYFTTTDVDTAYSLQDKFHIKKVYFDSNNNGIKTFVFNASKQEAESYLKEER